MAPVLEQSAANSVAKYQSRTCTATFTRPTAPGNLIVVVASAAGTLPSRLTTPTGFTSLVDKGLRDIQVAVWYRQAAPSTTSVSTTALDDNKSIQLRAMEFSGVAQASVIDKIIVQSSESSYPYTGSTGTTSQADGVALGVIVNQYASTTQFGFGGGLTKLFDTVSPQTWFGGSNQDFERSRMTIHLGTANAFTFWQLLSLLSCTRRWLSLLICFKGGSSGPARFTSTNKPMLGCGGTGSLTVFGPLKAQSTSAAPMIRTGSKQARIGPINYQYRLGGWTGLLIGDETPYEVVSHDGLEGWDLRTSDDDLPRGDGSLRGVDLQSSRQILFEIKVGSVAGSPLAIQSEVENAMDTLYRALVPQRDSDWELIWRHPGRPLRMVRVRPTNLVRGLSWEQTVINEQKFVLIATDPRHYSAFTRSTVVPPTAVGATVIPTSVINQGNGFAYPLVRIDGPTTGPTVTRIELINSTYDVSFAVEAAIPKGSTLVGDMEARATGAARSVVTIDTQSKYGAWQHPRETFVLGPGANDLNIVTVPAGAPVSCSLEYRDTWSG